MECMFLNKKCIQVVDKKFKQKLDTCSFDSDKDKKKITLQSKDSHVVIEHKKIRVTKLFKGLSTTR